MVDFIVISDFVVGVMENWGLIIYRLIFLLYDERKLFVVNKEWVVVVVVYEFVY